MGTELKCETVEAFRERYITDIRPAQNAPNLETLDGHFGRELVPGTCENLEYFSASQPLVLMISGYETRSVWTQFSQWLNESKRASAQFQLPGLDGRDDPSTEFQVDKIIAALRSYLLELKTRTGADRLQIHVVGHSMGTLPSVFLATDAEFLREHDIQISAVHLLAPAFDTMNWKIDFLRAINFLPNCCRSILRFGGKWSIGNWFPVEIDEYRRDAQKIQDFHFENSNTFSDVLLISRLAGDSVCEYLRLAKRSKSAFAQLDVPTYILNAEWDVLTSPLICDESNPCPAAIRESTFFDSGHFLPTDRSARDVFNYVFAPEHEAK